MFKLIGFIAGFYFLGFFGALLGLFAGSFIDRLRAYGAGAMNPLQNALRQAVFLETLFIAMGKLAKADGVVTQEEISHVEQFMQKMGMTAEHRQQAIAWFKQGSAPGFDMSPACCRFMSVCGHTKNLKQVLLVYLIVMSLADGEFHPAEQALLAEIAAQLGYDDLAFRQLLADGHFHPEEEALLGDIAGRLGYGRDAFKRLIDMVLNQTHFAGGQANAAAALDDAYKALGVEKDSTDAEIKRAYRKLISQYHPDKLMGQGVPEDMIVVATEQTKEIQLAYDLIKKSRES